MLTPGDNVDRYQIEALLGQGGMGSVYRALDSRLRRRVALKVVLQQGGEAASDASQSSARMLREARAAAALDHPNAISVFDVGEWEGGVYIAMELIQGKSLRSLLGSPPLLTTRFRWLADAARALAAAHRAGIIHRDIKPENIMVRDDGVVKVLDFGIARRTEMPASADASALSTRTGAGVLVGTPLYMAPEQLRGEEIDSRADQFSWGVLAWEVLVGELPWGRGVEPVKVISRILSLDPPAVQERVPEVPAAVSQAVARTLRKNPQERFPTLSEVAEVLERYASAPTQPEVETDKDVGMAKTEPLVASLVKGSSAQGPKQVEQPRSLAVWSLAGVAVLIGLLGLWALRTRQGVAPSGVPSTQLSAVHSTKKTPTSSNPEAARAQEQAETAYRRASVDLAHKEYDRASKLDPSLPLPLLRMALIDYRDAPTFARGLLQKALLQRHRLEGADLALLEAAEAWMVRDDRDAWIRRLERGIRDYPNDSLLLLYLAQARAQQPDFPAALEAVERAVKLDPTLALAWLRKGRIHLYRKESAEAANAYDRCLELSPTSVDCLTERMGLFARAGKCDEALRDVQAVINVDPASWEGYRLKASLLAGRNSPAEAVQAVLSQRWNQIDDKAEKKQAELLDRIALEQLHGRFQEVFKLVGLWKQEIASAPDLADHAAPAAVLCELYLELGKPEAAAAVAAELLQKREAYSPIQRSGDLPFVFVDSLYRAGKLSKKEVEDKRATWFRNEAFGWLYGRAAVVRTPQEASEALSALQDSGQPTWHERSIADELALGKVYVLAGQPEQSLAYLRGAAGSCDVLSDPLAHTQAQLYLGIALAETKDKNGACKAFGVVLGRWGESARNSLTAQEARKRSQALGCD